MGTLKKYNFGRNKGIPINNNYLWLLDSNNPLSYAPTGTTIPATWKDLSSNSNNFIPQSGVLFDALDKNSLFTNTSFLKALFMPSELIGDPDFLIGGWFKMANSNTALKSAWAFGNIDTNQNLNTYTNNGNIGISAFGTDIVSSPGTYSTSDWTFICWKKRKINFLTANIDIWKNGTKYSGTDLSGGANQIMNITNGSLVLGAANDLTNSGLKMPLRCNYFFGINGPISDFQILEIYNNTKNNYL